MTESFRIGVITNTHGLKGELKVFPTTEDVKRFDFLKEVFAGEGDTAVSYTVEGVKYIKEDIFTNGIAYLTLAFDCAAVPEDLLPYTGLLNIVIGLMDTENYTYAGLTNAINKNTGGIFTDISIRRNVEDYSDMRIFFDIKAKALYAGIDKVAELTREMIFKTDFSDKKRLKEIIAKTQSQLEDTVMSAGHTTAASLALSQFSGSRYLGSVTRGYEFFRFLKELDEHFEERADETITKLNELTALIFNKDNFIINMTADKEGIANAEKVLKEFSDSLPKVELKLAEREFKKENKRVGLTTPAQVNFVARAGNFRDAGIEYTGAMKVLKTILSYDYLWNNVRVLGGAYGCMSEFGRSGDSFFVSYRDPKLKETEEIFIKASEYVEHFTVSRRDMDKYIIGTIGSLDTPLTPSTRGARAFDAYLKNVTTELLKKERGEILECDEAAVRALAPAIKAAMDEGHFCAVGNAGVIEENKSDFDEISNLF